MEQQPLITGPPFTSSYVFRVQNQSPKPSYIQLLSPGWEKDGVTITIPEMQDPTIGRLREYEGILAEFRGREIQISSLFLWCGSLAANLDLFTLHVYEAAAESEDEFSDLCIIHPRPDPAYPRTDLLYIDFPFVLTEHTRISFIVPAYERMILELQVKQHT